MVRFPQVALLVEKNQQLIILCCKKLTGHMINEEGSYRTSSTVWCNTRHCMTNATVLEIRERISNMTGVPIVNYEHFQMLQYYQDQYYKVHNDYIEEHRDRAEGPRLLTVFMYLNNVEEGGGTDFPIVGKVRLCIYALCLLRLTGESTVQSLTPVDSLDLQKVMPKRGRVVVWPSVLDEDPNAVDRRTDHAATPVEKGVKYASNAWIHSRDFLTPFSNECF